MDEKHYLWFSRRPVIVKTSQENQMAHDKVSVSSGIGWTEGPQCEMALKL